jgi:hypothetical protein
MINHYNQKWQEYRHSYIEVRSQSVFEYEHKKNPNISEFPTEFEVAQDFLLELGRADGGLQI